MSTGRDMDLMISGNGFFVVQDAEGKLYYTRDGVFSTDSEGNVVTQSGMKVVAANSPYSNSSSGETVKIPKNLSATVTGDPGLGTKTISQLNNAKITTGTVTATVNGRPYTLNVGSDDNPDPTINDIIASFNATLDGTGVTFSVVDGRIQYTGDITFDSATSNFIGETVGKSNPSDQLNQIVTIQEMVNYNDPNAITLMSTTVDENGIIAATYSDGSILTQYVDDTYTVHWKYTTSEGVTIRSGDVMAVGSSIEESNFVLELATMVNEEGLVSTGSNLWEWAANVGEIYYGMAGEVSFGSIESGGYEGSNVDIAAELTNMITAQRMIQMNSRVFSTASSIMETLAYLGQ